MGSTVLADGKTLVFEFAALCENLALGTATLRSIGAGQTVFWLCVQEWSPPTPAYLGTDPDSAIVDANLMHFDFARKGWRFRCAEPAAICTFVRRTDAAN